MTDFIDTAACICVNGLTAGSKSLWAKVSKEDSEDGWLPLYAHMVDSGNVMSRLWDDWVPKSTKDTIIKGMHPGSKTDVHDIRKVMSFISSVHDIGKATPAFQYKISRTTPLLDQIFGSLSDNGLVANRNIEADRTPHSLCSQLILERYGLDRSLAVIAGGHHGITPSSSDLAVVTEAYPNNIGTGTVWESVQKELLYFCCDISGMDMDSLKDIAFTPESQILISGLVIMSDWMSSNEYWYPYYHTFVVPYGDSHSRSEKAWGGMHIPHPWVGKGAFPDYESRFSFAPRPFQRSVSEVASLMSGPGLMLIEAPMGEGKTEAALMAAEIFARRFGYGGVAFALPSQATSDGVFPRIRPWVDRISSDDEHTLFLAHGRSQFNTEYRSLPHSDWNISDQEHGAIAHQWFNGKKKGLLSDFVVCTVDQILMMGLKQKHLALRHLGLINKVVVIDECHAYDAYMGSYLSKVMEWFGAYRVPVILLSATMPPLRRKDLFDAYRGISKKSGVHEDWADSSEYPLITYSDGPAVRQSVCSQTSHHMDVRIQYLPEEDLMSEVEESSKDGGYIGVIVNTVARAQDIYGSIRSAHPSDRVVLLHSRFTGLDRTRNESDVIREMGDGERKDPPHRMFVIGTQVMEQSLDLDFDVIFTDICPIDLLFQRIGRLHRHDNRRPESLKVPKCYVLDEGTGDFNKGTEAIYGRFQLFNTRLLLSDHVLIPEDITRMVHAAYSDSMLEAPSGILSEYRSSFDDQRCMLEKKEDKAKQFQIRSPRKTRDLVGWLDNHLADRMDTEAVAAVRDTEDTVDVLLVQRGCDGIFRIIPGAGDLGGCEISSVATPSDGLSFTMAGCKTTLPSIITRGSMHRVLEGLEAVRGQIPGCWSESTWIADEDYMILDENMQCEFEGYMIRYSSEMGLEVMKDE